jgi:hypothetical protein
MKTLRNALLLTLSLASFTPLLRAQDTTQPAHLDLNTLDRSRILTAADACLTDAPVTVTAAHSPRSAGGLHDFFSEGDYWWPDPKNPDGPYIQKDGMTNPDNFVAHRQALMGMSVKVANLTAAYQLTHDPKYADAAIKHLRAWFVDDATKMNPNLEYAQAIHGKFKGRGIGIIDTIHLIEPARCVTLLEKSGALHGNDLAAVKKWFADYIQWLTTSKNGQEEMNAKNNHGTCFSPTIKKISTSAAIASKKFSSPPKWPPTAASPKNSPAPNPTAIPCSTSTPCAQSAKS